MNAAPASRADALAHAREAVQRLLRNETEVVAEVQRAEREVASANDVQRLAEAEAARARQAVADAKVAEAAAAATLSAVETRLAPRLRARYRALRRGTAGVLLGAASAAQALRLSSALDRVVAADLAALAELRSAGDGLRAARAALEPLEEEAGRRAVEVTAAAQRAGAEAESRRTLLASLREERALRQLVVAHLAREQEKLAAKVRSLPRTAARSAKGFAALKGKLSAPLASGTVEVPFGKVVNPKFNTVTHQKGWDVRAAEGTEVRGVAPGKVVHAGWFGGYGNLLIVDHGDGFHSLYAHLAGFTKVLGDEVASGDVVGLVGDTGSLKGAYLYFEIREDGKPVDPKGWIGRN